MVQQLELLVSVPAAACNLWPQLELSVSAHEADAPNSFSCWSQQLRLMVPAAGPLELLVSASETNGSNSWSHRSRKLRPMVPAAEAVGLSK
ncbi:hypothetical protein PCANC_24610 [Puccinia coronata f. sp. avenae]|uniref:Uncharacterized protein n=1 Tax=Puccinia coronata f. sp. avenae TaxID=200324 RepID=A0A2N5TT00_9BASI|nr:hypothetical protein PCANC_24610 [Puccinia coronata f. sp. avenae]